MKDLMTKKYVEGKIWWEEFKNNEKGVSPMVATLLILVMVVLLGTLFWGKIQELFNTLWTQISDEATSLKIDQ